MTGQVDDTTNQRPQSIPDTELTTVVLAFYEGQAEILRALTKVDLQILGGYMTIQLAFAAWISDRPPDTLLGGFGFMLIDFVFVALALKLLHNDYLRREEVRARLNNAREFLRLNKSGAYLPGKTLDPNPEFRPWWPHYRRGIIAVAAGVVIVLLSSPAFGPVWSWLCQ